MPVRKFYWKVLSAAFLAAVLGSLSVFARGPGDRDMVFGGPGAGSMPGSATTTIYAYPGFKGKGPNFDNMVNSYRDHDVDEDEEVDYYYVHGWRYSPAGWWYQYENGGWPSSGWKCIDARWYFFDEEGHVKTGWLELNGEKFYLNPVDDGTYGAMRTGWQVIDGKAYYFNASSEGTEGKLLMNTTTPDGYAVGADGALVLK